MLEYKIFIIMCLSLQAEVFKAAEEAKKKLPTGLLKSGNFLYIGMCRSSLLRKGMGEGGTGLLLE